MGTYTEAVQKLYVAYFSRPADAAGLVYWETVVEKAGGSTAAVSAEFAKSQEYKDTYAGMSEYQVVNAVYRNLFGRDAEPTGLQFWGQHLINKSFTIDSVVTQIAAGAQGTDATAYKNKVAAATAFTVALDTTAEMIGYSGTAANIAAKAWLAGVTTDASLTAAISATALNSAITNVVNAGQASTGQVFNLTDGLDAFPGTAGNDTFVALVEGTADDGMSLGDTIDGAAGTDTFRITTDQADVSLASVTVTNVEELVINSTPAGAQAATTANLAGAAFAKATFRGVAGVDGGTSTFSISGVSKATNVVLQGISNVATTINYSNVTGTSDAATVEVAGSTDSATLSDGENDLTIAGVENLTLNLTTGANDLDTITAAAAKAVTINVSGGSARIEEAAAFGAVTALTINADKNLTLAATAALANDAVITVTGAGVVTLGTLDDNGATNGVTVNASANTGGLVATGAANTVSITGGSGDDMITSAATSTAIVAGDGDDYVSIGAVDYGNGVTTNKTVSGGAGTDVLNVTDGTILDANLLKKVTGFELLSVAGGTGTYNLNNLPFDAVLVDDDLTGAVTISNVTDQAIEFSATTTAAVTIEMKDASGEEDTYSVSIEGARGGATTATLADDKNDLTVAEVVITDVETVTVNSATDTGNVAGANNELTALSTNAAKLVITGNHALAIASFNDESGLAANASIVEIDASASAGLLMGSAVDGANVSITGSAQADVLEVGIGGSTINAGQGGDVIVSAAAALDTLIVQAGDSKAGYVDADQSGTFSAAADILTYDVVNGFTSGEDTLDLGSFGFTGNKASALAAPTLSAAAAEAFVSGATASIAKFFVSTGIQRGVAAVSGDFTNLGGDTTSTLVFIDTNGDGNLSAADEMILLVGTGSVALGDIGF